MAATNFMALQIKTEKNSMALQIYQGNFHGPSDYTPTGGSMCFMTAPLYEKYFQKSSINPTESATIRFVYC